MYKKKNREPVAAADVLEQQIDKEEVNKLETLQKEILFENASQTELPKGVFVEITGDQIRYNEQTDYFEAYGNAETFIPSRGAKLFADSISYDGNTKLVEAHGKVRVVRGEETVTGTYASFRVDSRQYLVENPRLFMRGLKLKARTSKSTLLDPASKKKGDHETIYFEDGILALDEPKSIAVFGQTPFSRYSQVERLDLRRRKPEWEDLPGKRVFKFSADKITYDDTKKINNLKIEGARIKITDRITIPAPVAITTTVGEASDTQYLGPIFGTRTRLGGFVAGPRFYHSIEQGVFSIAPVLQLGNSFDFGVGAIGSFNTPGDTTVLQAGYGTLEERFIVNVHQEFPLNFEFNYLKNQFIRGGSLNTTQVGEFLEIANKSRFRLPFIDDRFGLRVYNSVAYAKDNDELFSDRRLKDLKEARGDGRDARNFQEDNDDFRSDHYAFFYTDPIYRKGNEFYNVSLRARGEDALRFYGNGDIYNIARLGPALQARIKNLDFEISYLSAIITGDSPFLFDQFVDGSQSILLDGDYRINEWLSLGGFVSYNISDDRFSRTQLRADIGREDLTFRVSYDTIRNQPAFGFNMIFGDPVTFDDLAVKI